MTSPTRADSTRVIGKHHWLCSKPQFLLIALVMIQSLFYSPNGVIGPKTLLLLNDPVGLQRFTGIKLKHTLLEHLTSELLRAFEI